MEENSFSKGFKSTSASSRFSQDSASSTSNSSRAQHESVGRKCPKNAQNARIDAHPTVKLYNKKNVGGALSVVPSQTVITSITQSRSSTMLETLGAPKGNTMQLYEMARGFTLNKQAMQKKQQRPSPPSQRNEQTEVVQKSVTDEGIVRGRGRASNRNMFVGNDRAQQLQKASLGGGSSKAQGFLPPLTNQANQPLTVKKETSEEISFIKNAGRCVGAARNKENFEGIGGGGGGGFRIKLHRVVSPQPELAEESKCKGDESEAKEDAFSGGLSESGLDGGWQGEKVMHVGGEKEKKKCEVKRAKRTIIV